MEVLREHGCCFGGVGAGLLAGMVSERRCKEGPALFPLPSGRDGDGRVGMRTGRRRSLLFRTAAPSDALCRRCDECGLEGVVSNACHLHT